MSRLFTIKSPMRLKLALSFPLILILFFAISFHERLSSQAGADHLLTPPLDGKLGVTGILGEYRWVTIHHGLDLSTGGKRGLPVHAAANGYVKRIMYGRYGIGLGVLIAHEDGRTSLYGHLDHLSSRLSGTKSMEAYLEVLNRREDFSANFLSGDMPVRAGDIIAYSGESGIGLPHLHFELKENDYLLDPLRHGLNVEDDEAPLISYLQLIPADEYSRINGKSDPYNIPLKKKVK